MFRRRTHQEMKPGSLRLATNPTAPETPRAHLKPLPDVPHPVSPLLLCAYALDSDRVYDWVVKYQKGAKPAVFLVGSKGDPNITP
jgi:hypothetical protein